MHGYGGQESSGREAFVAYEEEKRKRQQHQSIVVAGVVGLIVVLLAAVYFFSRRGHIPAEYENECRRQCPTANFLCETTCNAAGTMYQKGNALHHACVTGCRSYGVHKCLSGCKTNDVSACDQPAEKEAIFADATRLQAYTAQFCTGFDPSKAEPSEYGACGLGMRAIAKIDWPCVQGVRFIGKILSEHKL